MSKRGLFFSLILAILVSFSNAFSADNIAIASGGFKSFKDWRQSKIQQNETKIQSLKLALENLKSKIKLEAKGAGRSSLEASTDYYNKQLEQENWNLEISQNLSITDYVALYLVNETAKDRFLQAAKQLSSAESAELLEAYSNLLNNQSSRTQIFGSVSRKKLKSTAADLVNQSLDKN